jgi:hypothetical protein
MNVKGESSDGHPLDELVRIVVKDVPILESTWFGLVSIAGDVVRLTVVMTDETPLHSAGETGTATTAKIGLLNLLDNLSRLHSEDHLELGVATVLHITVDIGSVTLRPCILEDDAALLGMWRKKK